MKMTTHALLVNCHVELLLKRSNVEHGKINMYFFIFLLLFIFNANCMFHYQICLPGRDFRVSITTLASLMYGVSLCIVGVAFPVTEALRGKWLSRAPTGVCIMYNIKCPKKWLVGQRKC